MGDTLSTQTGFSCIFASFACWVNVTHPFQPSNWGIPSHTQTSSVTDEQIEQLRAPLPQVFSEGKIDFEKLRATLGDFMDERPERYSFTWAGKRIGPKRRRKSSGAVGWHKNHARS
jgi:hypothetical protein